MKRLEIRIDPEDLAKLQAQAENLGVSVSEIVRQAVKNQNLNETPRELVDQMTGLLVKLGGLV